MEIYNLFLFHFEQSIRSFCARERVDFAELLLFCELSFHSGHQRTRSFVRSMQRLMQYQSVFNMMWSFAQDGPPPYTFRQQSVSSRVIGNFGTSQLVGAGGWGARDQGRMETVRSASAGRRAGEGDARRGHHAALWRGAVAVASGTDAARVVLVLSEKGDCPGVGPGARAGDADALLRQASAHLARGGERGGRARKQCGGAGVRGHARRGGG